MQAHTNFLWNRHHIKGFINTEARETETGVFTQNIFYTNAPVKIGDIVKDVVSKEKFTLGKVKPYYYMGTLICYQAQVVVL
jgi:hypothetical protein